MTNSFAETDDRLAALSADQIELVKLLVERESKRSDSGWENAKAGRRHEGTEPTSWSQQRLWFIDRLEDGSAGYYIPVTIKLRGQLNEEALHQALNFIVQRHEILRTVFISENGEPRQRVIPSDNFKLDVVDLNYHATMDERKALRRIETEEIHRKFDLANGPLIRGRLIRIQRDEHVLLITMHHIVSDGWSIGVLIREIEQLYSAHATQCPSSLQPLPLQYIDYVHWQRQWLQGEALNRQVDYWRRRLQGAPPHLSLPTDRPRPDKQTYRGGHVAIVLDTSLTKHLREFGRQREMTPFMVLLSAWLILLSRLSGQEEIVVGTPIANRQLQDLEGLIGFFVNTLALRFRVPYELTTKEFLEQIKETTLEAYDHQDAPFEKIVEVVQPQRSLDRNPLFQVMFAVQNAPKADLRLPELEASVEYGLDESAIFDLLASFEEGEREITGNISYAMDLFDEETIQGWMASFDVILGGLMCDENKKIGLLPMLSTSATEMLTRSFNENVRAYDDNRLVHHLFEDQVRRTPDGVAVEFDGSHLTYLQLNERANQLAAHIQSSGSVADRTIAVFIERGISMIVCLLGVMKAGAAYIPLDPTYPKERLRHMLADAHPQMVITQSSLLSVLPAVVKRTILIDADGDGISGRMRANVVRGYPLACKALYVIYTSGSTGRPKGTVMSHGAMTNLIEWHRDTFGSSVGKRVLQFSALSFDVAFQEIFSTLCTGGSLILLREETRQDPRALLGFVAAKGINRIFLPPLMLQSLAECFRNFHVGLESLEDVITAGEQLHATPEVRRLFRTLSACRLHNHYGPTETHVVTAETLGTEVEKWRALPRIGSPIANARTYILNSYFMPVPVGVSGEIYIGGVGMAQGYHNRPELTAERFIADPFLNEGAGRMYRTGDVGRWHKSGALEYVGRNDDQVKIRGFRVELGEIEARLTEHMRVREAAVVAHRWETGDVRLVAYVVPWDECGVSMEELRAHLSSALPAHMHPSTIVFVDTFPRTPSGKLDRRALPRPQVPSDGQRQYREPEGEIEQALAEIWKELLQVDEVSREDNFFELGGHSLLIMRMMERLRAIGFSIVARTIYGAPTLARLAQALTTGSTDEFTAPENLIPTDCDHIIPEMLTLVQLDENQIALIEGSVPGGAENIQDIYPLAPLQQGVFYHSLLDVGGNDAYARSLLLVLPSRTRAAEFSEAWQRVIDRYDILRTAILWEGLAQPVQVVYRRASLTVVELPPDDEPLELLMRKMRAERNDLDLRRAPLVRLTVAGTTDSAEHVLLLETHHIVFDNESLNAMLQDVMSFMAGREPISSEVWPYRNYVAYTLHRARTRDSEEFFRLKLRGLVEPTYPLGVSEVKDGTPKLAEQGRALDSGFVARLRRVARRSSTSAATIVHAAWALVVSYMSGRDDVVFGCVLLGRFSGGARVQRAVGMAINTLPLRIRIGGLCAQDLVLQAQRELVDLMAHEHAPLALAQRSSGLPAAVPLFSALLSYTHDNASIESAFAQEGICLVASKGSTNYPIMVSALEQREALTLHFKTDPRIDVDLVASYLENALNSLVEALEHKPSASAIYLPVLPSIEWQRLMSLSNGGREPFTPDRLIHQLFEEQADRTPNAVAVVYEDRAITFAQLDHEANKLALLLRAKGVAADRIIGLYVERSLEMLIGILAIWKAGGAYVPLDPAYPIDRVAYIVEDAGLRLLLTQHRLLSELSHWIIDVVSIEDCLVGSGGISTRIAPEIGGAPLRNLAYVIYTSGSTGRPKGVMIEHRDVVNLWRGLETVYDGARPCHRVAVNASFNFDASVKQIVQLLSGRTIFLVPDGIRSDPTLLFQYLSANCIQAIDCTPSQLRSWLSSDFSYETASSLQMTLVGGEAIDSSLWERLAETADTEFYNVYGPTECTVDVSLAGVRNDISGPNIGFPMMNRQVYIVDEYGRLAPTGATGELFVGGLGVARGYLRRPELTAARFVADPFSAQPGMRMYRTGDLGRWRADGSIDYAGRNDHQVKIRGFRVELGEIEAALLRHPQVAQAAVLLNETSESDKRLVAYVAPCKEQALSIEGVRAHLATTLPEFMLPGIVIVMDALPVSINGKIDRRALPHPDRDGSSEVAFEPVQGPIEAAVAEIWQELLDVARVGRGSNFFELGGHSLLGVRLIGRIANRFKVTLPISAAFQHPTVAQMAAVVASMRSAGSMQDAQYIEDGGGNEAGTI